MRDPERSDPNYREYARVTEVEGLLRELTELRRLVAALCAHLGATGTHSPYR